MRSSTRSTISGSPTVRTRLWLPSQWRRPRRRRLRRLRAIRPRSPSRSRRQSSSRSSRRRAFRRFADLHFLFEHDLFRKPASTFRDHALGARSCQLRQRLFAGHRPAGRQRAKVAITAERCFQQLVILAPRDLDRTKALEVVGHKLSIEQLEAAGPQTRDQVDEGDLGSVARAVEHALAEEGAAERDAVEPTDQQIAVVDLNAVAMAALVELAIEHTDAGIDPGALAAGLRLSAAIQHAVEVAVDHHGKAVRSHRTREPAGQMKTVERNDPAHLGLNPVERRIVRALGHGKDAARIGLEQDFGRDLNERGFAIGHMFVSAAPFAFRRAVWTRCNEHYSMLDLGARGSDHGILITAFS